MSTNLKQDTLNAIVEQDVFNAFVEAQLIEEAKITGVVGQWKGTPIIEIDFLISWLDSQKYRNIDETSDNMTEEFEREHLWELSKNCFINKMIRKLKELK